MKKNPYVYTGPLDPIKDNMVCIPRSADLSRITESLLNGDYWTVYGARQSGRTTFLRLIQNELINAYTIYIDCQLLPGDASQFYQWLINLISEQIPSEAKRVIDKNWEDYSPVLQFLDFLETFNPKEEKRIVLLFDEVANLPFIRNFLHLWRKVFHDRYNQKELMKYSVIITSSHELLTLTFGPTAPFNIAKIFFLKDFSVEESGKLIYRPFSNLGIQVESKAIQKLISHISGHPQLLQHTCHYLVDIITGERRNVNEKDIDNAINNLLLNNSTIEILKYDVEKNELLYQLIQKILKREMEKFLPYKEFSVTGAGCITQDEKGFCTIRNKVFERFLKDHIDFLKKRSPGLTGAKNLFVRFLNFILNIFRTKSKDRKVPKTTPSTDESDSKKRVRRAVPYGIGSYEEIRKRNLYYVDKTAYIKEIENAGMYLFFIRPRRFGKTLFLSMLETYYDVNEKEKFDSYFKGTQIFRNPTSERNSYLMLKFDFSEINVSKSSLKDVEDSFRNHVLNKARIFISKYKDRLNVREEETNKELETQKNPSDLLGRLLTLCRIAKQKVYLIIDEYDNFANTILSATGRSSYEDLTHGEGFFRTFFKVIKAGTSGTDIPIERLFITGVSPITMDDVTSGFNIGKNVSIDKTFNEMMGFREVEVLEMIEYYRNIGEIQHEKRYLFDIMNMWYNNYRFAKDSNDRVFNPTLVLYFLDQYLENQKTPDELFDNNVKTDYEKLKHLILIDKRGIKETNGNFSKLKAVIEDGFVKSKIIKEFPLNQMGRHENFSSLLFYFGLLTISAVEKGDKLRLTIPNESAKKLFYEYIREAYMETGVFSLDHDKYVELIENMAYKGEWEPLFRYIAARMEESMSLRDLVSGEKFIHGFLLAYLGWSDLYCVYPEREMHKGYADLVMEPYYQQYKGIKFSYIIEIKYLKRGESKNSEKLERLKKEAAKQLQQYNLDKKFRKTIEKTTLIKVALVFAGHQLVHIEDIK